MSKKNDDFFVEKKPWSVVKDGLLGCYLKPYISKVLHTGKPITYVDCFAGKGKFDDGQLGSPLIALDIMERTLSSTKKDGNHDIKPIFIEPNHSEDLKDNLKMYPMAIIISDTYENTIDNLLKNKKGFNVFLYIDPYGIKSLNCSKFDEFASKQFNSIELLINMNSFGFIRDACRVMGSSLKMEDDYFFDDLVEYEPTTFDKSEKSIQAMNDIAGGEYWQDIILRYKNKEIDGYNAEEFFSEQYCQRLSEKYRYVLNMPIRIHPNQHPKYRMIHATNHPSGCVLMADNMCNRWELLKQIQDSGQMSLFQEDFNNNIIDEGQIKNSIIDHFSQCDNWTSLTEALAVYFVKYGAICKSGEIEKVLKKLEKSGRLAVDRHPAFTEKGKPSSFMTEGHGKTVKVRWVN